MVNGKTKPSCTVFRPLNGSQTNSIVYMSTTTWFSCVVSQQIGTSLPIASPLYVQDHTVVQNSSCFLYSPSHYLPFVFLLLQLLLINLLIDVRLSQILMNGKFHAEAHVRNLNMCSRTRTHSLLWYDVTSYDAVNVRCILYFYEFFIKVDFRF